MLLAVPLNPMPSHTVQLLTHTDNALTPAATTRKPVYPIQPVRDTNSSSSNHPLIPSIDPLTVDAIVSVHSVTRSLDQSIIRLEQEL